MIPLAWWRLGFFVPQFCPGFSCWKLGLADPRNSGAVETTGPPCPESNPPRGQRAVSKARECYRQLLAMTPFTKGAWWAILLWAVTVVTVLTWRLFTLSQDQNKGNKPASLVLLMRHQVQLNSNRFPYVAFILKDSSLFETPFIINTIFVNYLYNTSSIFILLSLKRCTFPKWLIKNLLKQQTYFCYCLL